MGDADARSASEGYRPHLDGLRAVAVYLVVAFHAGSDRLAGGFVGVDVFFVLSGYLVTRVLMGDLAHGGRIDLLRFYARRVRRLLPASLAMLLVTGAVFTTVASPVAVDDAADAIRACFLYVANWHFIAQEADYFGADVQSSPVAHFWSLAVEEQFYLTWPILLGGLAAACRRFRHRWWVPARIVVAGAAVASVVAAVTIGADDVSRAYYGTDTRAYQLLVGAFLALAPELFSCGPRAVTILRRTAPVALVALGATATSLLDVGPITRGIVVTALAAWLIVAVENAPGGIVGRALSVTPLVYLGKISYGTYLWHWPVIVIVTEVASPGPGLLAVLAVLLGSGIASLSYALLEDPVRRSKAIDRSRGPVVAIGLAASIVAAFAVVPAVLDGGSGAASAASTPAGSSAVPTDVDWVALAAERFEYADCLDAPAEACVVIPGTGPRIMLVGDSTARMLLPAISEIARAESAEVVSAMRAACPWQEGLVFTFHRDAERCRQRQADWYDRLVPELDPDIVILSGRSLDDPGTTVTLSGSDGGAVSSDDQPAFTELVRDHSAAAVRRLEREGRRIVIVEPMPLAPEEPLDCLSTSAVVEPCRFVALGTTDVERAYRDLADERQVWALDADALVCPYLPICDPVVGGIVVRRDIAHLTTAFTATLVDELTTYLRDNGILG